MNGCTVKENAADGYVIGSVAAWDQDPNAQISWSLIGVENNDVVTGNENDDGNSFWGNLQVKQSLSMDFKTKQVYTMTLRGEDQGSGFPPEHMQWQPSSETTLGPTTSLYSDATITITITIDSVAPASGE